MSCYTFYACATCYTFSYSIYDIDVFLFSRLIKDKKGVTGVTGKTPVTRLLGGF